MGVSSKWFHNGKMVFTVHIAIQPPGFLFDCLPANPLRGPTVLNYLLVVVLNYLLVVACPLLTLEKFALTGRANKYMKTVHSGSRPVGHMIMETHGQPYD